MLICKLKLKIPKYRSNSYWKLNHKWLNFLLTNTKLFFHLDLIRLMGNLRLLFILHFSRANRPKHKKGVLRLYRNDPSSNFRWCDFPYIIIRLLLRQSSTWFLLLWYRLSSHNRLNFFKLSLKEEKRRFFRCQGLSIPSMSFQTMFAFQLVGAFWGSRWTRTHCVYRP